MQVRKLGRSDSVAAAIAAARSAPVVSVLPRVEERGGEKLLVIPAEAGYDVTAAPLAQNVRLIRSGMLEVLQQDYVRTARAKGLAERLVIYRHALRNAAIPVITVSGLSLGFMLSGAVIIETVFSWPGMGRLIVQAVPGRDFPVIQAVVLTTAVIVAGVNLCVDCLYAVIDPRIRYAR